MIIQGTTINGMTVSSSAAGLVTDSYFNLVSLLLPGNGTNGAQNNTFQDSSTNAFTITRNGNTTQGTFSPFSFGGGTAQANGYYSGYFDGTGDYLNQGTNRFLDGSTWTVEGWVYTSDTTATIAAQYVTSGGQFSSRTILGISSGLIYIFQAGSSVSGTTNISNNQWYHIAYVRNGSTVKAYVNGRLEATFSGFINPSLTTTTFFYDGFNSGQEFFGYFSNLRVTTTEVYASNFTPPTSPLTAITGTSLLTCQSSQFIDNSTNAFAITVNGNSQPTVVNPFGMTDWSGYFDGTGDYLTVANNAAFDLGSGDATIEAWIYPTSGGQTCGIFDKRSSGANYSQFPQVALVSGAFVAYVSYTGSSWAGTINGATPAANTWTHVAFVRSGNTWTLYVNGVVSGTPFTASGSVYTSTDSLVIGASTTTGTNAFAGQISNARVVKGTAVYTSAFSPPTVPLTAISGTSLLTCQSSTFIDNSTNAFAITVNGNAYTGTLNNPFDSTVNYTPPSLQAWSNYFDGTGDYLSFSPGSAFAFGTGDFTVECWVYPTVTLTGTSSAYLIDARNSGQTGTWAFVTNANGSASPMRLDWYTGSAVITGANLIANTWNHCVYSRATSTYALFLNGTRVATGADSTNYSVSPTTSYIATRFSGENLLTGYLSNIRTVKGTAVYSPSQSTITVPTSPLSAVANTVLLTCQSNGFADNSINRFAMTRYGDASVQAFSPFNPDAAYSTTTVGGSGYFDGTGDYLTLTGNSSFAFGTGDFTLEAWVYITANQVQYASIFANSSNPDGWFLSFGTSNFVTFSNYNVVALTSSSAVPLNAWTHIAVARSGTSLKMFFNGVQVASATNSTSYGVAATTYIGFNGTSHLINGYVANARVIKGTAVYTSAFIPPTAPLTAISGTSLLLNYTNAGITDATAKNVIETVGNASISTTQSKFGGSSLFFDGNADALLAPSIPINALGTGDFTIEAWIRWSSVPNSGATYAYFFAIGGNNVNGMGLYVQNGKIKLWNSSEILAGSTTLSADTWYHVALVRSSGTVKLYLNGTQDGTVSMSSNLTGGVVNLGYWYNITDPNYFSGYINDLRITKGYARYTANFTPPTAAFPTQ